MKSVLSLALLVFLLFGVFLSTGSASAQTTDTAVIIVQVRDQYGAWYDGVQVQISAQSGSSLFTGITQNGFVASGNLTTGQYYTVIVSSPTSSKNQTVYLSTQNIFVNFNLTRPAAPVLSINKVNFLPNLIAPGSTFTAQITISSSTAVAYNAMISFNTTYPLGVTGTGSTFPLGLIGASSTYTLNANFSVAPIASTGDYNVPYSLTFSDVSGVTYTSTGQITVPVTGTPTRPQLIVAQVHFNPQVISSGTTFTTYINVNNTGSQEAYGASISVQPATQVSLIGSSGATEKFAL
ncbi:MAG: hypothetical protein M1587_09985, partial [Thaumarchaeota archaeon]|nr:hypothetical protein [Nitrososphaerota archaeon]